MYSQNSGMLIYFNLYHYVLSLTYCSMLMYFNLHQYILSLIESRG